MKMKDVSNKLDTAKITTRHERGVTMVTFPPCLYHHHYVTSNNFVHCFGQGRRKKLTEIIFFKSRISHGCNDVFCFGIIPVRTCTSGAYHSITSERSLFKCCCVNRCRRWVPGNRHLEQDLLARGIICPYQSVNVIRSSCWFHWFGSKLLCHCVCISSPRWLKERSNYPRGVSIRITRGWV